MDVIYYIYFFVTTIEEFWNILAIIIDTQLTGAHILLYLSFASVTLYDRVSFFIFILTGSWISWNFLLCWEMINNLENILIVYSTVIFSNGLCGFWQLWFLWLIRFGKKYGALTATLTCLKSQSRILLNSIDLITSSSWELIHSIYTLN